MSLPRTGRSAHSPAQRAHRSLASHPPKAAPAGLRKSLSNLGGPTRVDGYAPLASVLSRALDVPEVPEAGRYLTHGFHAWPARLHPHTARAVIAGLLGGAEGAPRRAVVADPFMGGGTVLTEAMLAGLDAVGTDLNPVAIEVAWVRTAAFPSRFLDGLEARLRPFVRAAADLGSDAPACARLRERVPEWFEPGVLVEIAALSDVLNDRLEAAPDDEAARVYRAALSSIIVKVSRQRADSVRHAAQPKGGRPERPHAPGTVGRWVAARVHELTGQLRDFGAALPRGTREARIALADARTPPSDLIGPAQVDLIVTSPPYLGVYDYVQHHLLRSAVLGFDVRDFARGEVGSRRDQRRLGAGEAAARYRDDLVEVFRGWRERMRPDGLAAVMIGDGQLSDGLLPALPLMREVAAASGWEPVASGSQARPAFIPGQRDPGVKEEHLVLLRASGTAPSPALPASAGTRGAPRGPAR
jgi:hypothetical protein